MRGSKAVLTDDRPELDKTASLRSFTEEDRIILIDEVETMLRFVRNGRGSCCRTAVEPSGRKRLQGETQPFFPNVALNDAEPAGEGGDVLTLVEAAAYLGCHPKTLRKLAVKGEILGKQVGNRWRFSRKVLEEWLRKDN